jgi:hypothetical protein
VYLPDRSSTGLALNTFITPSRVERTDEPGHTVP